MHKRNTRGFHLIEILITLIIISILVSFALPSYQQMTKHAEKVAAAHALARLAVALEHYFLEHGTYEAATLSELHFQNHTEHGHYQINIEEASENNYLISATANQYALENTACGKLTLNSQGIKGPATNEKCWN